MNIEHYLNGLERFYPLSFGLRAYLSKIYTIKVFQKHSIIQLSDNNINCLPYLYQGSLRIYHVNDELETTIAFGFEGDLIMEQDHNLKPILENIYLEFMEETVIFSITKKHMLNVMDHYLDARILVLNIKSAHISLLMQQLYARNQLKAAHRYSYILNIEPRIDSLMRVKDISSYLGIDAKTLSRIRSSPLKK